MAKPTQAVGGTPWTNIELQLIGPFGLFAPSGVRIEISSKKAIALIALLATAPSGERSRRWLQAMLWGTREHEQAQTSLRREVSTLSKQLEVRGAGELLLRSSQRIGLQLDRVMLDTDELGMRLSVGRSRTGGDFLEGLDLRDCEAFEDWLRDERERVHDMLSIEIPEPSGALPSVEDILGEALPAPEEILRQRATTASPETVARGSPIPGIDASG